MTHLIQFKLADRLPLLRQAYVDGKLGAQNDQRECAYSYPDDCRCAIGAMLTPEEINSIVSHPPANVGIDEHGDNQWIVDWNHADLMLLEDSQILTIDGPVEDWETAKTLQTCHDLIVCADPVLHPLLNKANHEKFRHQLNLALTNHGLEPVQ